MPKMTLKSKMCVSFSLVDMVDCHVLLMLLFVQCSNTLGHQGRGCHCPILIEGTPRKELIELNNSRWFQICFIFILGEMIQFDEHIFPMGWAMLELSKPIELESRVQPSTWTNQDIRQGHKGFRTAHNWAMKKQLVVGGIRDCTTHLCGDSFINHEIRIRIQQPGFHQKYSAAFFFSWLKWHRRNSSSTGSPWLKVGSTPQDSSHHQDLYIFGIGNPYKLLFATGILGGGVHQNYKDHYMN